MSELRQMLNESVTRLFEDQIDHELLSSAEQQIWPDAIWDLVAELGIDRVLVDEDMGGVGCSWSDVYPVIRACGRYAVPLPLPEAILARWLIGQAGIDQPAGVITVLPDPLSLNADGTVSGIGAGVPWGQRADLLVGVAAEGDVKRLVIVDPAELVWKPRRNLAAEPRDAVTLSHVSPLASAECELPHQAIFNFGAMLRAGQMAGAAAAMLDQSLRFAGERSQFGRQLVNPQVIQHNLARLAALVASIDSVAAAACHAMEFAGLGESGACDSTLAIAAAKCRASALVDDVAGSAHQVHGAIGFTYKHGLHFASRRLWSWRSEFGNAGFWARQLGEQALSRGGDGIWSDITRTMAG